ncbi:hypothetical protein MHU86_9070 [Fragilaria crotonensis]|nr:hypothetical protein MHU86_9070 [Fragilaria crotonensis]
MGSSHSLPNKNGAIKDIAAAKLQGNNDNNLRNNSSSTFLLRQEDPLLASYKRPIKKQHVRFNTDGEIIKNKDNNEVAKRNSFKNPAIDAEDLHNKKRGTIRTALESAF